MITPSPIHLFENHDEALRVWRTAGARNRILVHVDAHHDLKWKKPEDHEDIGNYIGPALQEGLVREVWWVVPDGAWIDRRSRRPVLRHLKKMVCAYPSAGTIVQGEDRISASLLGKPIHACPLGNLPPLGEEVLLDVDVDYLVIPKVSYGKRDEHPNLPWRWPAELVRGLEKHGLRAGLVTIAYSVEGGYTPLKWKYLGDELACRLAGAPDSAGPLRGFDALEEGARSAALGDRSSAEERFQEAARLLPASAAPHLHLALLCAESGQSDTARNHYRTAVERDATCRSPYNTSALIYYAEKRLVEAESEYRRLLALDPEDAFAWLGLGRIASRRKRWDEAETHVTRALALDPTLVDAHRELGKILSARNDTEGAIRAYETSLKLALEGHRSLSAPILTEGPGRQVSDPGHAYVHGLLGRLYDRRGRTDMAVACYRMSFAGESDRASNRLRLALLYAKSGKLKSAGFQVLVAISRAAKSLVTGAERLWNRLGEILS